MDWIGPTSRCQLMSTRRPGSSSTYTRSKAHTRISLSTTTIRYRPLLVIRDKWRHAFKNNFLRVNHPLWIYYHSDCFSTFVAKLLVPSPKSITSFMDGPWLNLLLLYKTHCFVTLLTKSLKLFEHLPKSFHVIDPHFTTYSRRHLMWLLLSIRPKIIALNRILKWSN